MTWETGSAYWLEADPPGELHGDVNEGPEPIEVIVVQLKGVASSASSVARLIAADGTIPPLHGESSAASVGDSFMKVTL